MEEWSSFFAPATKEDNALRNWFHARAIFLGANKARQNVELGIRLASQCTTIPDAVWLCSLFPNGPPKTREEAFTVLEGTLDPRSLGYRASNMRNPHFASFFATLSAAATLGCIMAQSEFIYCGFDTIHREKWLHDTLQAQEPRALLAKSRMSTNHNEKCYYMLQAARFGSIDAIDMYIHQYMDDTDPEKYAGLLFLMSQSYTVSHVKDMCNMCIISRDCRFTNAKYRIGSILARYPALRDPIVRSDVTIQFFNNWTQTVKSFVICWQLCSKRLGICRDIRLLIAKLIWNDRWNVKT
jgi:hypothetical protein